MKNDVFEKQKEKAGKYTKQYEKSLGMTYWSNDDGSRVIWFKLEDNKWRIAPKKDLGTNKGWLYAIGNILTCPDTVNMEWLYVDTDQDEWLTAGNDMRVSPYSGGTN